MDGLSVGRSVADSRGRRSAAAASLPRADTLAAEPEEEGEVEVACSSGLSSPLGRAPSSQFLLTNALARARVSE